uniref:KIAA1549 like n=1 Tax=Ailuropoda melanoleuca TaxID=9646 RepID=A0A7N5KQF1_AILME
MLPSFSMIPSQPAWVGTPSISTQHSPRPDMLPFLPPPSSSSLAPDSPHSIIFSKPVEQPTQVAFFPQRAPPGSSSSQSVANSPNPFADDMNHTPSKNAQDLIGIPHIGFSGSSTMQQPKLPPTAGPYSAGPPTPEFLSSMAELTHLPPLPLVPGSLPWLPDGPPSWSVSEVASSPTSTQPVEAGVAEGVHSGSSLPTSKSAAAATVTQEAVSSLFQTAKSVAEEMTSRKLAAATANDLAHPMHSSAAPENSQGPVLSAKHTASSLVPFPLPLPTASRGQTILSRAWKSTAADLPSVPTFPQLAQNHGSPSTGPQMSSPQEGGTNGSPPAAATDLPLSSKSPDLLSTTWAFPLQEEDSVTAVLKKNEKANLTVAPQTLPSKETPSLHTVNGFTSDSSTDHTSSFFITTLRTNLPLESAHPSLSSVRSTQTLSPPPSLSNIKPEAHTAVVDHSELPTSQQVMAFPSAAEVYDFSTTRHVKKPATTDVFWSSLSMETGSLSIEPMISGLLQQTNYDLNGHAINSTSWETHSASAPPPSGSTSAANTIKSSDFRATAGLFVTTEGFSIQLPVLRASTNQPIQRSEVTMVGSHTDVVSITSNYSRDFQTAEVEENPTASQRAASHPRLQLPVPPTRALLPASPSLTSTASLHQVLADGMDTSLSISRDVSPSPVLGASPPFQSLLRYHSTDESPLSPRAILRTPSKVLLASQRPDKWSGAATHAADPSVSSKAEPTAAAAATSILGKSSPLALSAALVAKGTGSSPSAMASGLVKSSWTTALAKNATNNAAPKTTAGAVHPAFSFTPTYMFSRTAHTVSAHTAMQGNTGTASGLLSTTYVPRKPQAMHTGLPNPTHPDVPRASTARPLTITAALTSITAPVRATRLPPVPAGNTDTALPAASTAVVTTGKTASNLECQMSSKLLVKTVLFLTQRRAQISETLKFNLAKGLTQALRKAFHQNDISAHVDILEHSHNVTVGYYATKGRLVYLPAVVIEMLGVYGVSNVTADLKQHTPNLQSVAVLASPWNTQPAGYLQLRTVLQFVSQSDNIQSCKFAQTMEQRLQKAFQDAERKVLNTKSNLTIQIVSTSNASQTVTLVYVVGNRSSFLNGTVASSLLRQLSAELVGFYLTYPPLTIAEPLEYPNLDISETTRDYWVITAVVKNPPNNLWIIAAVLAPIAVVTVIIIIITAVLCRKNKNDFKPDTMMSLPQRAKPVQGFDYAKQHLGQQGADEEVVPVTQETVVLPLPVRDAPAFQERDIAQDGSTIKTAKSTETRKSRSPSENGSVISNESGKPSSGRRSPQNVMAQQKVTKEEARKRNVPASDEEEGAVLFDNSGKVAADPFDTSSGSVQLIAIKPTALPVVHPTSDRSQESAALNGEVNKALKQKSDIEHYRNKLRLKAKRKGYYDFPPVDTNKAQTERKKMYEKTQKEIEHVLDPDPELCAPFAESKNRQQMKNSVYRSRQSLNSPSPGETEMDLLVTRERPRRGIRNSGYDTEPEIIEETNIDRVNEPRGYARSRQVKGHSETSTLSSQPSIDEVRQQMHMLLEEAFSLASAGHAGQSRHQEAYGSAQHLPYSEVVTSAPGTMTRPRAGVQWVPTYRPEMYQYSLPRPAYRFSQLPEMVMGSPPPPVPPRTGPVAVASLRRSTSDVGSKTRMAESAGPEPAQLHDSASFAQVARGPVSVAQLDQSALNYSGNTVPAVFAIPAANRPGFTGYFIPTPPSSYRNQAWMSYAGENELPSQWADSVPLPGYIEAYPRSRYQQNSPSRLPRQYSQPAGMHPSLEQAPGPSTAASQQSLAENDPADAPLTNISTAALVKAIREEVAKLAKKQTDMFEFQV